eukprot:5225223-Pleurochrysis_carterae.AAC.1
MRRSKDVYFYHGNRQKCMAVMIQVHEQTTAHQIVKDGSRCAWPRLLKMATLKHHTPRCARLSFQRRERTVNGGDAKLSLNAMKQAVKSHDEADKLSNATDGEL